MQGKSTRKGRDKLSGNIKRNEKEKKERRKKENPGIKK